MSGFPRGFLWGTASAAHQVEGDNKNCDWWEWEQQPGKIANGDSSLVACDNYHRYRVHHLPAVRTARLRLEIAGTHGSNRAQVYEVRVYGPEG